MKLSDLIPSGEQINFVQGIEGSLLKSRRLEIISGIVALMGGLLQVLIGIVKDFEISQITSAISVFSFSLGILFRRISNSGYNKIGIVYYRQKEFEEAIEYFSKATQLNPAAQVYLNNIADAYNELGNFEEAKKFYDQALQVHEV